MMFPIYVQHFLTLYEMLSGVEILQGGISSTCQQQSPKQHSLEDLVLRVLSAQCEGKHLVL